MVLMQTRARGVEGVGGQPLDDVLLAELEVVVRRHVLLELLERLSSQIAPIDQKQDRAWRRRT